MRTKRFRMDTSVTRQALVSAAGDIAALVREQLDRRLAGEARGPRGGRYVLFGPITHRGPVETGDDFIRDTMTYRAERMGRYVRPSR